ncbi:hypothetical protein [Candidatus Korobacter versatilis]|uniref:hypothetical protein n=1 Tax=Candidatus Korobacter versatilis TaxID=658062 RepID=UPI0011D06384|nr:hypothetical protein [Candidatus Koribacter versatilis]
MRLSLGLLFAFSFSMVAWAQEPSPTNGLAQPAAQPSGVTQTVISQGTVYQAPVTAPVITQSAPVQPIPVSLSVPMSSMPSQPQISMPVAQMCGCGIKH